MYCATVIDSGAPSRASPVSSTIRAQGGRSRRLCPTISFTPWRRHAATMSQHSRAVRAIAFSQNTCTPASAAATVISACTWLAAVTSTASRRSRRSNSR